jgi:hypothetical protein
MNIVKKIAIGAAILGAATIANAENLIFGAYVEPIIMIETEGRIVPADALLTGSAAYVTAAATDISVGAFRVTTNLVKWNMKIVALNKGILKSRFGSLPLTTKMNNTTTVFNAGQLGGTTKKEIFVCPIYVNTEPAPAAPGCQIPGGTTATLAAGESRVGNKNTTAGALPATTEQITGTVLDLTVQSKLSLLAPTICPTLGATCLDFYNVEKNSMTFEIRTGLPGDEVTALAGTYTETLYMAVYGSY